MKTIWSDSSGDIQEELNCVINENIAVSLQTRDKILFSSKLKKIVSHDDGKSYLVLKRPDNFGPRHEVVNLYYKKNDRPIMCFPAPITSEYKDLIATMLPEKLFFIERRNHSRVATHPEAKIVFLIGKKNAVSTCKLENLSLGGAKISGNPTYDLVKADTIGPATLTLSPKNSAYVKELTVANSTIVRSVRKENNRSEIGIRFDLSPHEKIKLTEYLSAMS